MVRVIGIDPGLRLSGYGVVDARAGTAEPTLVEAGVIRLSPKLSVEARLVQLHEDLRQLFEETKPDTMAIEKIYAHYAHPRTAIVMAHARGVILLAAQQRGMKIHHLGANEVKKSLTGHGHASKEQMQRAVQSQYKLAELPEPPDVADAIAIATCYARRYGLGG